MGRQGRKKSVQAFTLIELMVVVAILGVLSTIVATNVYKHFIEAQQTKARADIKTVSLLPNVLAQQASVDAGVDDAADPFLNWGKIVNYAKLDKCSNVAKIF